MFNNRIDYNGNQMNMKKGFLSIKLNILGFVKLNNNNKIQ